MTYYSPAEYLSVWLSSRVGDWPVYVGNLPDLPDNVIVLSDSGSFLKGRSHKTGFTNHVPSIQVRVRGVGGPNSYRNARAKLSEVMNLLETQLSRALVTVGTAPSPVIPARLWSFSATSGIFFLGYEDRNRRPGFTVNGVLTIGAP